MSRPPTADKADGVDTRTRIQQVALELFIEKGYEATSLREIAERLGVTKAALYYHFRTKEEIVQSLFADQLAHLDALLAWGEEQPRTRETRQAFVRRYADMLCSGRHFELMRFFERNQTSMQQKHQAGATLRERLRRVQELLTTPDDPPALRLRRSLAIMALHTAWFALGSPDISDDTRRAASLEVALSLVE
jgi:AcrR family transcriptional regulator